MNTLESFYQDLEELLPYVGKDIKDDKSPDGTSKVEYYLSNTREFLLSNSGGRRKVIWYELERLLTL